MGKTSRMLKTRINEHICSIQTHDNESPVAAHFNWEAFIVTIIIIYYYIADLPYIML